MSRLQEYSVVSSLHLVFLRININYWYTFVGLYNINTEQELEPTINKGFHCFSSLVKIKEGVLTLPSKILIKLATFMCLSKVRNLISDDNLTSNLLCFFSVLVILGILCIYCWSCVTLNNCYLLRIIWTLCCFNAKQLEIL